MAPTHWWELRAGLAALLVAAAPVLASSHPAPTDLNGTYDPETGIFTLTWDYASGYAVDEYNVYLDGELLGTSTTTSYDDNITTWIGVSRTYEVTAVVDGDESPASAPLRLVAVSTGGSAPFWCIPVGVRTYEHEPYVAAAVYEECLPTETGGSGGGE